MKTIIVAGLTRCGLTLTMQILDKGAADCVVNRSSDCYNGMLELSLIRSK